MNSPPSAERIYFSEVSRQTPSQPSQSVSPMFANGPQSAWVLADKCRHETKAAEDRAMGEKRATIDQVGARAAYFIERWKRGVGLMLLLALIAVVAVIVVGIPMLAIGEIFDSSAWSSPRNITIAAVIVALPFYLTHEAFLNMLVGVAKAQREENRIERRQ